MKIPAAKTTRKQNTCVGAGPLLASRSLFLTGQVIRRMNGQDSGCCQDGFRVQQSQCTHRTSIIRDIYGFSPEGLRNNSIRKGIPHIQTTFPYIVIQIFFSGTFTKEQKVIWLESMLSFGLVSPSIEGQKRAIERFSLP